MARPTTFNLYGDGDDVAVIEDTEELFGIAISEQEAANLETFGDLVSLVERKLSFPANTECLLRGAFRQFREGLEDQASGISPSTRLSDLYPDLNDQDRLIRLSNASGLMFEDACECRPVLGFSFEGSVTLLFVLAAVLGVTFGSSFFVLACLAAFGTAKCWPQRISPRNVTIADLLRETLFANFTRLRTRYGNGNAADRRVALESLCRSISGYGGPVNHQTTFFAK